MANDLLNHVYIVGFLTRPLLYAREDGIVKGKIVKINGECPGAG